MNSTLVDCENFMFEPTSKFGMLYSTNELKLETNKKWRKKYAQMFIVSEANASVCIHTS